MDKQEISLKNKLKYYIKKLITFCATMLLSVMTSCFLFLPSALASTSGKGGFTLEYLKPEFHCSFGYIFRSFMITQEGNVSYNQPAIYVSAFTVVLSLMFFWDYRMKLRKKILIFALLLFVFLSFSFVPFELIWTILKKTYSFHFRYAFVFSFLLVYVAAFFVSELKRKAYKVKLYTCIIAVGLPLLYFWMQNAKEPFENQHALWLFCILLIVFGGGIYGYQHFKLSVLTKVIAIVACAVFVGEQCYNIAYSFRRYNITVSEFNTYVKSVKSVVDKIKERDSSFYRMEQTITEMSRRYPNDPSLNEGILFGYNGITHYSSFYDSTVNDFLAYVGYSKKDAMLTNYEDSNLVMDSLLGIKYMMTENPAPTMKKIEDTKLPQDAFAYYNENALSFGTVVDSKISNFPWSRDNNVFENQSRVINEVLGTSEAERIFRYQEIVQDKQSKDTSWVIRVKNSGPIYLYFLAGHPEAQVFVNGEFKQNYFGRFFKNVMYVGEYEAGDEIRVDLQGDRECQRKHGLTAVSVDLNLYQKIFSELKANSFEPEVVEGGFVEGSYNSDSNVTLMLSVPFDPGWKIWIDGTETEYREVINGLMAIDVSAGPHKIRMKYVSPYFEVGLLCTILGGGCFLGWQLLQNHSKIRRKPSNL